MSDVFKETPVKGLHLTNSAAPDGTALLILPAVSSAADPAYTEGNAVLLSTDLSGRLRVAVETDSATPQHVIVDSGSITVTDTAGSPLHVTTDTTDVRVVNGSTPLSVTIAADTATLTVAGTHTTNAAAPTTDLLVAMPAVATTAAPTYTTGDAVLLSTDTSGNLRVVVSGSSTTAGTLSNNNAGPAANNLGVLPAFATAAAPGYTGGNQVLLSTDLGGNLRTLSALTVGGSAVSAANPLPVVIEIGGSPDAPANPLPTYASPRGTVKDSGILTAVAVAAGANATLAFAASAATNVLHLLEATFTSTVRCKVEIQTVVSATPTTRRVFVIDPLTGGMDYKPPTELLITAPSGATVQLKVTNLDNVNAADIYGSLAYLDY